MKLILVVDNTGSMGESTRSARTSVEEIRAMLGLLMGRPSVKLSVYGDYDTSTPDHHCGGWSILHETASYEEREAWIAKYLKPMGGGGCPEAQKTAFNHLLHEEEQCIVFHFTDAPPHLPASLDSEGRLEELYLTKHQMEQDWDCLCVKTKTKHRVVTFLTAAGEELIDLYAKMGEVVIIGSSVSSTVITSTMMSVLYELIGQPSLAKNSILFHRRVDNPTGDIVTSNETTPEVSVNLHSIMDKADPCTVIEAFSQLLNPDKPDQAICLTSNSILGKYWRKICGKYRLMEDGKYETIARDVMEKLSQCKTRMNLSNQQTMKEWIDESFDDTPTIRQMVSNALPHCTTCLVLRGDPQISLDDLLALGRAGVGFKEMAKLLATLEEVPLGEHILPEDDDQAPKFVPLQGLNLINVFRLIANLIKPGIMFSSNASLIAAILSLPNKYLASQARQLLTERKGKWIDLTIDAMGSPKFPVYYAINFIRILQLIDGEYLTEEEIEFRDKYMLVATLIRNHDALLTVTTGIIQKEPRLDSTWKRVCRVEDGGCGHPRCFTIFPGKSLVCGICISSNDPVLSSSIRERDMIPADVPEVAKDKTHWVQCHCCRANYGVTRIDDLNVRPKCYYCRMKKNCPAVECHLCLHKYVSQDKAAENAMNCMGLQAVVNDSARYTRLIEAKKKKKFVCPRCVDEPQKMVQESEVKLGEMLAENTALRRLVPVKEYELLVDSSLKLWKRVVAVDIQQIAAAQNKVEACRLTYGGFTVHKPSAMEAKFQQTLLHASPTLLCPMCVSDTPIRRMTDACGSCSNRICRDCIEGWYGQVVAGCIISQSQTLCPFCKKAPKYAVIRKLAQAYLRNIRTTKKASDREICGWDPTMWHGACTECLMVKPVVARECAGEAPPIHNYICNECVQARNESLLKNAVPSKTQFCPGCNVSVEKNGGCNHITCTRCNEHWCWGCGQGGFDSHSIYDHMCDCTGIFSAGDAE